MKVAYHAKNEREGWRHICTHELHSPAWSKQDQVWIDEMLQNGDQVITIGWNMYQLIVEPGDIFGS